MSAVVREQVSEGTDREKVLGGVEGGEEEFFVVPRLYT